MIALLSLIPWLRVAVLIALLFVLQLFRWEVVVCSGTGLPWLYRLDRLTGAVDFSYAGQEWTRVLGSAKFDPSTAQLVK